MLVEIPLINHLRLVLFDDQKSLAMKMLFVVIPSNNQRMMEKLNLLYYSIRWY
jgi:hypothetical protein